MRTSRMKIVYKEVQFQMFTKKKINDKIYHKSGQYDLHLKKEDI